MPDTAATPAPAGGNAPSPAAVTPPAPAATPTAPTPAAEPDLKTPAGRREAAARAFEKAALEAAPPADAPAAAPTNATPPAEPPKPPEAPKAEPQSKQLAALVERERKALQRESSLKEREAKLAELEKQAEAARGNPVLALQMFGHTFEKAQDFVLNGNKPTPDAKWDAVQREVEALKEAQRKEKEAAQRRETASQMEAGKANYRAAFKAQLETAKEKYPHAAHHAEAAIAQAPEAFQALMYDKANRLGRALEAGEYPTWDEVMQVVDRYAFVYYGAATSLTPAPAGATLPNAAQPSTAPQPPSQSGQTSPPRTLTNAMAAAAPNGPRKQSLSRDELRRQAEEGVARLMRGG